MSGDKIQTLNVQDVRVEMYHCNCTNCAESCCYGVSIMG